MVAVPVAEQADGGDDAELPPRGLGGAWKAIDSLILHARDDLEVVG